MQRLAIAMLEDETSMCNFSMSSRVQLTRKNYMVWKTIDDKGIEYYPGASAGFILLLDLRAFLPEVLGSGDGDRWNREAGLTERLSEHKVHTTEGKALNGKGPGRYRLICSRDEEILQEGFRRSGHCLTHRIWNLSNASQGPSYRAGSSKRLGHRARGHLAEHITTEGSSGPPTKYGAHCTF